MVDGYDPVTGQLHTLCNRCTRGTDPRFGSFYKMNNEEEMHDYQNGANEGADQIQIPVRSNAKRWIGVVNYAGPNGMAERDEYAIELSRALSEEVQKGTVDYYVIGKETGSNGTPHLQIYMEFNTRRRFNYVKSTLGGRAHIEVARGNAEQNMIYCKKDGEWTEGGTPSVGTSQQGKRSDLKRLQEALDSNMEESAIAKEHFGLWLRHGPAIKRYKPTIAANRCWVTELYIFWGETGTGKTRWVVENNPNLWIAFDNAYRWFDGYQGEESVLFDDVLEFPENFSYLLKLIDRYPMVVPVKGGSVKWCPKKVYMTSNVHYEHWKGWGAMNMESQRAFERRITEVKHFLSEQ